MIVISKNLVLSQGARLPLSHPIIGWRNVLTRQTVEASSQDSAHPVTNIVNPSTAHRWRAEAPGEHEVAGTLPDIEPVDYVAMAGHNLGTAGIVVFVESRMGEDEPWEEIDAFVPPHDRPVLFRFEEQTVAQIRLRLIEGTDAPTIAVLYIGRLLVMERGVPIGSGNTPMPYGRRRDVVGGRSESGHFLGRIVTGSELASSAAFEVSGEFYRKELDPFVEASADTPFFYAQKPQARPCEVSYCWMTNDPAPVTDHATGLERVTLEMSGADL